MVAVTIPEVFNDAALSIAYAVAAFVDVDAVPVKLPVITPPVTLIPALAVITPTESTLVTSS